MKLTMERGETGWKAIPKAMALKLAGKLPKAGQGLSVGDDVSVIIKKKKDWAAPKYCLVGPARKVRRFVKDLHKAA